MRQNKLLLLLVLLMTAATGAWAQTTFTAKEITSASQLTSTDDEAYVADCMPSDFLAVDENVAKAWTGAPKDGSAILIYAIEGDKIKIATFLNGDNKTTTGATWSIATFKNQLTNGRFFYTATTYSVTLAEGTEDEGNWTISPTEAAEGAKVTVTYSGEKKVKSVKAVKVANVWDGDLSKLTAESTPEYATATDGMTITGTLAEGVNVKVSIADGANVTLKDATINGKNNSSYKWAGLNCAGDATITLEGTNMVKGFYEEYPGIFVPVNKTLTIQGTGSLNARSNGYGAGIGGGWNIACGNIVINSGTVEATGGQYSAGIGGGQGVGCGDITINGGTITATGGNSAAGIGSANGNNGSCGNITINGGTITATGGQYGAGIGGGFAPCGNITISGGNITATGGSNGAGIGGGNNRTCGNITISGGTVEATGGDLAAGIGGGSFNPACGTITITSGVTSVKATKGNDPNNYVQSIGCGDHGSEITVNIENGANVTVTVTLTPGQIGGLSIHGTSQKKTINGITIEISGDAHFISYGPTGTMDVFEVPTDPEADPFSFSTSGTFTFTSSVGKIKRIDINHNGGKWWGAGDGWPGSYEVYENSTFTWSGTPAASVTLNGSCQGMEGCNLNDVSSIVFTLEE